jgi:NADPH-dependent 2,4-dienoyl-CoA reductase/sulfur reductase-like enzyme
MFNEAINSYLSQRFDTATPSSSGLHDTIFWRVFLQISRRKILMAGMASAVAASSSAISQPMIMSTSSELMPKTSKRRVVITGGGWGGLTAARHIREEVPELEVVVLERNPVFWSCPLSNKWLIDAVDTNYLVHSYMRPAQQHGYTFIQTEITGIDREKKQVHTAQGHIDYDWLVVSPGIRYGFEAWFGNDRRAIDYTRTTYPTAYIPSAEHALVKQKIHNFKGGTFVMTLPPPPHRCPPSPYERACLMAWHFKQNKIPAKIVILDPKPRITPITIGFQDAFQELYPDIITHVPNATIKEVDPFNKVIKTAVGDFKFDDALLMTPHQAGDLAWKAGLIGKDAQGKPTGWAAVHPLFYNVKDDPQVFVAGDSVGAVSPNFGHYPKSGHIANRQAKAIATHIAQQAHEKELKPVIIDNLCYMLVNNSPREAISVQFDYKMGPDGNLQQTLIDDNDRREELWRSDLQWADLMFKDFVAG